MCFMCVAVCFAVCVAVCVFSLECVEKFLYIRPVITCVCVYVQCVCACLRVRACVCMCACTSAPVCMCACVCMCVCFGMCACACLCVCLCVYTHFCVDVNLEAVAQVSYMGWLQLVGSIKLYVSFAKETYKRDAILQKRPVILSILLTVATPYDISS